MRRLIEEEKEEYGTFIMHSTAYCAFYKNVVTASVTAAFYKNAQ